MTTSAPCTPATLSRKSVPAGLVIYRYSALQEEGGKHVQVIRAVHLYTESRERRARNGRAESRKRGKEGRRRQKNDKERVKGGDIDTSACEIIGRMQRGYEPESERIEVLGRSRRAWEGGAGNDGQGDFCGQLSKRSHPRYRSCLSA